MPRTVELEGVGKVELPDLPEQASPLQPSSPSQAANTVVLEGVGEVELPQRQANQSQPEGLGAQFVSGLVSFGDRNLMRRAAKSGSESALQQLGQREGVPFDVASGIPPMQRMMQSFAMNREEQRFLLSRIPNVQDVRFNNLGDPILTIQDPQSGEVRDVLANPIGLDPGDFAFLAANAPEIIAGAAAARGAPITPGSLRAVSSLARSMLGQRAGSAVGRAATGLASSKSMLPSAARMAVAGQSAGAAEDVAIRGVGPLELDFGEIVEQRGENAALDFLFGLGAGTGAKATSRTLTPLGKRGPLQLDAEAAQKFWERRGVLLDLTPGEATGSPFLLRGEAFMTQKPGSASPFLDIMERRRANVGKIQNIMLGTDPALVPAADIVGDRALRAAGARLAPLDFAVDRQTQDLLKTATKEIEESLVKATNVPNPLKQTAVGGRLFERSTERLTEFRAQSRQLYGEVYNDPAIAGQGRNIDATPLAQDAKQILDEVAAVEKTVQKPTGLTDQFGSPLTQSGAEVEKLGSFVEGGTLSKLRQLADAEGGKVGLRDLIELRRDIDDELFRGSALGGLPERRLNEIRKSLTDRIKGGLQEIDQTGGLLQKWEKATTHYADNIKQFKDIDIVSMFNTPEQRGALGLSEIVERAIRDPDRYAAYRDFFGPTSNEMNMVRRVYADRLLGRVVGSDIVDASKFLGRVDSALSGPQREIIEDALGPEVFKLRGFAKAIQQARKKNVDFDELVDNLERGTLTSQKLEELVSAQNQRAETFKNDLFRKINKGSVDRATIQPSKAVDNIVFQAEPKDVQEFAALISDQPEILDEIRQRTILKIVHDSTGGAPGKETLTALGLSEFLDDPVMVKRLRPVIGQETLDMMKATRDFLKPGELKERIFKSAGGISAGQQVAAIEESLTNPNTAWSELSRIVKSFVVASAYKAGPVRNFIANTDFGPGGRIVDKTAMVNAFIMAEPLAEDLIKIFGEETGRLAAIELKQAIDATIRQLQPQETEPAAPTQ